MPTRGGMPRKPRRPNVKSEVRGFKCVNALMNRAIGKVLTKARSRERASEWGKQNRARQQATVKRWSEQNPQRHKEMRKGIAQRRQPKANARNRVRRREDPAFCVKYRMRARLSEALRLAGGARGQSTAAYIGCSYDVLSAHLREQWHAATEFEVDHVFPFAAYNMHEEGDLRRVMHYSNTQPLLKAENLSKSDQLPTKAMAAKVARWAWPDGVTEDMLPDKYDGWRTPLRM